MTRNFRYCGKACDDAERKRLAVPKSQHECRNPRCENMTYNPFYCSKSCDNSDRARTGSSIVNRSKEDRYAAIRAQYGVKYPETTPVSMSYGKSSKNVG